MDKLIGLFTNTRFWFFYISVVLFCLITALALIAPTQLPVTLYKLCLLILAGLAGYCIDRALFPYAEPSGYLAADWRRDPDADNPSDADYPIARGYGTLFAVAMLRQTTLISISMLAVGLGL